MQQLTEIKIGDPSFSKAPVPAGGGEQRVSVMNWRWMDLLYTAIVLVALMMFTMLVKMMDT